MVHSLSAMKWKNCLSDRRIPSVSRGLHDKLLRFAVGLTSTLHLSWTYQIRFSEFSMGLNKNPTPSLEWDRIAILHRSNTLEPSTSPIPHHLHWWRTTLVAKIFYTASGIVRYLNYSVSKVDVSNPFLRTLKNGFQDSSLDTHWEQLWWRRSHNITWMVITTVCVGWGNMSIAGVPRSSTIATLYFFIGSPNSEKRISGFQDRQIVEGGVTIRSWTSR